MTAKRLTNEELAEEAKRWLEGKTPPVKLVEAPHAVPRAGESVAISIRLPRAMLSILKEFAERTGVGYQVLIKRWLDERIRDEHRCMQKARQRKPTVRR